MTESSSLTMKNEQLLTMAGNLLHSYFIKANKDLGKKRFKEIDSGKTVKLGSLSGENSEQEADVTLSLDTSEFKGHLTFHLFAGVLEAMLKNYHDHLSNKKALPLFTVEVTQAGIFLILANMLVLGVDGEVGTLNLKLQFLDPEQFKAS